MKRWTSFVVPFLLIGALLLSGCAAATPAAPPPAAEESAAEEAAVETAAEEPTIAVPEGKTGLVLMGWSSSDSENVRLQEMVDAFNEANPDLFVTLSQVPDYDTKLQVSLAGGSPPDVFYVDAFKFHDLHGAGALEPLGDAIEGADDFYPNLAGAFTADDTLYCAPKDFSTLALIYNKGMFADAGVAEPTTEWTWTDLRAAAEALTNADTGVYGMVLAPDLARWLAFLVQAGGSIVNEDATAMTLDTPEARAAVEFYVNMVRDGFAAEPANLDAGWAGEAFGRGNAAMAVEGNWIIPYLNDSFPDVDYGVIELPAGDGGKGTVSYTVCYAVASNGRNKEAATRLVNALTGAEGMQAWTDLGLAMPTRASLRDHWLGEFPDLEPFLNGADYAVPWQFPAGFQEVMDQINADLQQAFAGTASVDQVLSNAQSVGTEVLGR